MKRIIFFASLIIFFNSCSVTKIAWDRNEKNEVRHIGTEGIDINIENSTYKFSLTVFSSAYSKEYFLLIGSRSQIDNKSLLLLKLGNDEIIKLVSDTINVGKVDWPKYIPIIGGKRVLQIVTTEKVDYNVSLYPLDPQVLEKIEQFGVLKLRIPFGYNYKEKNWVVDRLGVYLQENHELIEAQLKENPATLKKIEENF